MGTVRVFRQKFTLEDAIGSYACSLEANTGVTNSIPLGSSLLLPVDTVNCVQTLKATKYMPPFEKVFWRERTPLKGGGVAGGANYSKSQEHTVPPGVGAYGSVGGPADAEDDATKQARKAIGVVVKGGAAPLPVSDIKDLRFPKSFRSIFEFAKIDTPTPVQQQCWPAVLYGANVLGLAETGSGKTLAYLIPAVPHILARGRPKPGPNPVVLVLVPTRELAAQVEMMCGPITKAQGLRCVAVYGGSSKADQKERMLSPTPIVAATPGRLLDMVACGDISLEQVTYLVLDEADRMLTLVQGARSHTQSLRYSRMLWIPRFLVF
jgi:hypothetical protein